MLAGGTARVLLTSIPPFQEAMQKLENKDFNWKILINSGDEFDQLAVSFNGMAEKLIEKERLSSLVSRNVLDAISSTDAKMLKPGGSRVEAAILFSDIRSFTTITEKYAPEQIVEMLNDYFSAMTEIVEKHGGIIDKLIGDAIQAVFYDHELQNCSYKALSAGLEMREALKEFNQSRIARKLFEVDNGIGICSGTVICGRVGSEHGKLDATVIGSIVNMAANLEAKSKFGQHSKVVIDSETAKRAGGKFKTIEFSLENDETKYLEVMKLPQNL